MIPIFRQSTVVFLLVATLAGASMLSISSSWAQDSALDSPTTELVGDIPQSTAESVRDQPEETSQVAGDELTLGGLKREVDAAALAGHNAWMLVSCALVLFMTAPGLAMFYGGLVRRKNVLSVMMQCIFLMGLMTVIWATYGYSLAFGGSGGYIGNFDYLFMNGVQRSWDEAAGAAMTPMEGGIPRMTHMLFQGMFFIITPALICGAFAERMKFSAMVIFSILWGTFIYCPLCHWVWDGGPLAYGEGSIAGGALDFAGGTVVHVSSGISALIAALLIGPRMGYPSEPLQPHNLSYTVLGAAMLWVGWFGFNAGSGLLSDEMSSSAFMVTHFSAAAGAVAWAVAEWVWLGKPTVLGASSGAVAGLVCITPAAGFVQAMPALLMGAAAGVTCFYSCSRLKHMFGYDDALDAFGVHGVGGTLGAVLTGVFATRATVDVSAGVPIGLIESGGNMSLLIGQVVAVVITYVFAGIGSLILLKLIDIIVGLRVPAESEQRGLDITDHGEEGYQFA
ncbi:Ammonia channel precursor [Allorhodopirellula heiligendammensis]|uniref:Ammonium transporter n=2 Tax=Allorhodopirellula heiligendammensis TaxID=2714739 RepID=A0A5C6BY40_9BACT|nr:ammonium transporter [Allorhodopirellula heiligendammensis]TWU16722.1 Ammonia channel precursor [Allorhodopirellula heiligendammensis]